MPLCLSKRKTPDAFLECESCGLGRKCWGRQDSVHSLRFRPSLHPAASTLKLGPVYRPVIPTSQEAEAERSQVQCQPECQASQGILVRLYLKGKGEKRTQLGTQLGTLWTSAHGIQTQCPTPSVDVLRSSTARRKGTNLPGHSWSHQAAELVREMCSGDSHGRDDLSSNHVH